MRYNKMKRECKVCNLKYRDFVDSQPLKERSPYELAKRLYEEYQVRKIY